MGQKRYNKLVVDIKENILLAPLTTFNIGGPAKFFCKVQSVDQLKEAVSWAKKENLSCLIIGGGSNLLISDEGFPGLVIKNESHNIRLQGPTLEAQSGTSLQELVDFTISHGLLGMQKLTGIYGTVGGALFGNAGAYGQTICDYIAEVIALDPVTGQILKLTKEQCKFGYRDSDFKRNSLIVLEVHFQLPKTNSQILKKEAEEIFAQRLIKFPPSFKCPGSFFKNIPVEIIPEESLKLIPKEKIVFGKLPAAVLLELVGAKGQKVGGAQVLQTHANLIVNIGNGKALDIYNLAKDLTQKVKEKFGVTLEPEVQFINLPPLS